VNRWFIRGLMVCVGLFFFARTCTAPLIYRPGEGWTYEPVGSGGKWERKRARDQLQVAQEAFDQGKIRLALKAARRVARVWPLSDYAGRAQYLVGRCYETRRMDERAFKEYQKALVLYPRLENYQEIQQRQFEIANRFLGGQWFRLWGYIPFFPNMDRTARLFDSINRNGPYSDTGAKSLMNVGAAREKQKDFPSAVRAYERAADKYFDRPIAADALYAAGLAWNKQARRAEYDQSIAANAINFLDDFRVLYPKDERVPDASKIIDSLKTEQARGAFETARFYERYRRYQGALVYYNEVLQRDPKSPYADEARERIELLRPKAQRQIKRWAENDARFIEWEKKAAADRAKQRAEDAK
jgi:outer membrane protein assembly factor BamD